MSKIIRENKKAASIASLRYVENCGDGIQRRKHGKHFRYFYKGKEIKNKSALQRIRKLAIPPSWNHVWICPTANGHLQATGFDLKNRKQYKYHDDWNDARNETKFHRLLQFGKALPRLRKKLKKDLSEKDLTENKVLAAIIKIMQQTFIRIGSNGYERLYGSYGLTTLKNKHVTIKKDKVLFSFNGKKGVSHEIILKDQRLARIVRKCRDMPGKELFQYYTANDEIKKIDSGMVNQYIREAMGEDFTAKDFRTWAGTLQALESFQSMPQPDTAEETKENVNRMIDDVSKKLGNTHNICKKYYIHPGLIHLYEENNFFGLYNGNSQQKNSSIMSTSEKNLIHILKKCRR